LYRDNTEYAASIKGEIQVLREVRKHILHGNMISAMKSYQTYYHRRQSRYESFGRYLELIEAYWEYIEGSAFFIELLYWGDNHGDNPYGFDFARDSKLNDSYFLDTGAILCSIIQALDPHSIEKVIKPGRAMNLDKYINIKMEDRHEKSGEKQ